MRPRSSCIDALKQHATGFRDRYRLHALVVPRNAAAHELLPLEPRNDIGHIGGVETDGSRENNLLGYTHLIKRRQDTVLHRRNIFAGAFIGKQGGVDLMKTADQKPRTLLKRLRMP